MKTDYLLSLYNNVFDMSFIIIYLILNFKKYLLITVRQRL